MDREAFGKKTASNCQRLRTDRFIPPRSSIDEQKRKRVLHRLSHEHEHQQDSWYEHTKYQHYKRYKSHIDEVFGLDPPRLPCSTENSTRHGDTGSDCAQHWPCIPRKKRHLTSADSVLDLPNYQYAFFPELLDWNSDDILVAALEKKYYTWSWRTQSLVNKGFTLTNIYSCKYDPRGELLALGTDYKAVEIHTTGTTKGLKAFNYCACLSPFTCFITAVDWSPTGNSFVTGCSRGTLSTFTRTAKRVSWRRVCRAEILYARVSPNARFVACTAVAAQSVFVFTWPFLQPYSAVDSDWTIKSIAWHPWSSALLAVGAVTSERHATVALMDGALANVRQTVVSPGPMNLDAMLFSHSTGELVLSLWNLEAAQSDTESGSRLLVLSDPDTVVDQWGDGGSNLDRVRTMVFSPDGTKLATATAGEDLIIWSFLPEDNKKKKKEKSNCHRRFSALPVYFDEAVLGFSLR